MWLIRLGLFACLAGMVGAFGYLLSQRERYRAILESRSVNIVLVIAYNVICYAMVTLPPAEVTVIPSRILRAPTTRAGFLVLGTALIPSGIVLCALGVRSRRAIGAQDAPEGLLTSGVYRYFRHPIYTGIVWISLGLPLVMRNLDGLLVFPAVLAVNVAEALLEERFDVGARFSEQYKAYRQTTGMLGPRWVWGAIVAAVLASIAAGLAAG